MNRIVWLTAVCVSLGAAAHSLAQGPQAKVPEGTEVHRDLEYVKGGHERQRLDLYLPQKADGPRPVIVWIHGGAWLAGSKQGGGPALPFVRKGYAVASLNYRLSQHASVLSQKSVKQLLRPGPTRGRVSSEGDSPCHEADAKPN